MVEKYISKIDATEMKSDTKPSPFTKRIKKNAWIMLAIAIVSMIIFGMNSTSKSVDTSEDAVSALETHMSTILAVGTKLLSKDDNYVGGDLTITHDSDAEETTLYFYFLYLVIFAQFSGKPISFINWSFVR